MRQDWQTQANLKAENGQSKNIMRAADLLIASFNTNNSGMFFYRKLFPNQISVIPLPGLPPGFKLVQKLSNFHNSLPFQHLFKLHLLLFRTQEKLK